MKSTTENKTIALNSVKSSQIAAIGHDPETNTLSIQFVSRDETKPGNIYHYENFTSEDFAAFNEAESIGSHFYKHIRPNTEKYPYKKIS